MMLRCLLAGFLTMMSSSFGCAARDGRGGWARRPMAIGALSGLRFVHVSTFFPEEKRAANWCSNHRYSGYGLALQSLSLVFCMTAVFLWICCRSRRLPLIFRWPREKSKPMYKVWVGIVHRLQSSFALNLAEFLFRSVTSPAGANVTFPVPSKATHLTLTRDIRVCSIPRE